MALAIDDYILQATGGPSVMDGLVSWLKTNGASNGAMADLHNQFLTARGYTAGTLDDRWDAFLVSLGYTGSLQDKLYAFWKAGGTFGGGGGGPTSDPYIDYVVSYLEFNGYPTESYNTVLNYIDTIGIAASWTGLGSAALTGDAKVSGNASLRLNGSAYLTTSPVSSFILGGEFTVEAFINLDSTAGAGYKTIAAHYNSSSNLRAWWLTFNPACDELQFWASTDGISEVVASASVSVSTGTWYHVAATRDSSGVIRVFFNGQAGATTQTIVGSLFNSGASLSIGARVSGSYIDKPTGYLDEFRLTNGFCRYTTNFTPPTGSLGRSDIFSAYFASPIGFLYAGPTKTLSYDLGEGSLSGVFLKQDGTKLYLIGNSTDLVRQYDLSTPFDLNTAKVEKILNVSTEEGAPNDLYISPDGLKLYIVGNSGVEVNEYTLSTAWDVSTATHVQAFSVSAYETVPMGLYFKPDGTKMYITGSTGDTIDEYDLSTPWDISTAVYLQEISVSAQNTTPMGVFFSPDGTHMYMVGQTSAEVNQYLLGTPWDVSTASFVRVQTFNQLGAYYQMTTLYGGWLNSTGTRLVLHNQTEVWSFTLGTAWDVSTATWDAPTSDLFTTYSQDTAPKAIDFKPDGTKMYMAGITNDKVYEYNLSIAWDVASASFVQDFSVVTQDASPRGIRFSTDGDKMYVVGQTNDKVYQYDVATPWDVSTASFVQDFSVALQEITPTGLFFKPDGTKMYVVGTTGDDVNEYALGTAWDISTATFTSNYVLGESIPNGIFLDSTGTYMYSIGAFSTILVRKYILSTPWDVTSATYVGRINLAGIESIPTDLFFKPDLKKLFWIGEDKDAVVGMTLL